MKVGLWRQDVGTNSEAGPEGKRQEAARNCGVGKRDDQPFGC